MDNTEKQKILAEFISEGEKEQAIASLTTWSIETSFKEVIFEVLEPLLITWGKLWMQGKLSLAHGYISGKVAEEFYVIASGNEEFNIATKENKGTIVLGNIEDDFHPLGRRLVKIFSQAMGWNMIDLGNDIPAEVFVEKAIENKADIIAISAMMFTTAKNIIKVRKELDTLKLSGQIKLAVGGAVFKLRPELVTEIGGDGTADTAIEAPQLFERLLKTEDL
ncbi:MAG: cobalamin-dependent protein [Bacteroidales bacterium]|nr:cobalamin-dependent protein [Bacteroidales bacterium]